MKWDGKYILDVETGFIMPFDPSESYRKQKSVNIIEEIEKKGKMHAVIETETGEKINSSLTLEKYFDGKYFHKDI